MPHTVGAREYWATRQQIHILTTLAIIAIACPLSAHADGSGGNGDCGRAPNVIVILSDDQGYADVSYNPRHPKEVRTPHTDSLAREGVVCTQGYTSGHVCSPTRAGLMTGRYQQRFGIYTAGEGGSGVPLDEVFFPHYLKPAGYVSGALGKWHLGLTLEYNAINRGFDEFYGFMGRGAHDYFNLNLPDHPIYRGVEPIEDQGYLTDRITEEAVSFIERHKSKPFFLYVAYNAVHAPPQAPEDEIEHATGDEIRDTLMAMLEHLDDGVGHIVAKLKREELFENTLLFYLTDNGGAAAMHANNAPLRGFKQQDYEGGIRVPWIVSWPARLTAGTTCPVPVCSIDILPTTLAAAGVAAPDNKVLDGMNILPALRGEANTLHEHLFWSSGGRQGKWAIRSGKWKLVAQKDLVELFDLEADLGETTDLAEQSPEKVAELTRLYDAWLDQMAEPAHGGGKRWDPNATPRPKKQKKNRRDNP
ncbi:sulfatase-like hydrolase/transferase [Planctomycetota bacterium]